MHDLERRMQNYASLLIGAILIALGVLFLADQFLHISVGRYLWPFAIIAPGAMVFVLGLGRPGDEGPAFASFAGIMTMTGLIFLFQSITDLWATWAYAWALIFPTSIGLALMLFGTLKRRENLVKAGSVTTTVGLIIVLVGFAFFELLLNISGLGLNRWALPIILIGLGLVMLISVFRPRRTYQ